MALVRLQKYFSDCGIMSRRAAEEQIRLGNVLVNGAVAKLGDSVESGVDTVEYNGKEIIPQNEEKICIMLNKPRGYVTTMSDEKGRRSVNMLTRSLGIRVYPIGRLDMDSEGLLLLTNDGALTERLTHPRHDIPKVYHVTIKGEVSNTKLCALGKPMLLDGYEILPVKCERISQSKTETVLRMTLFEGRNRQIRKMCASEDLCITMLRRVAIGELCLEALPVGKWRRLSADELKYLRGESEYLVSQKEGTQEC